MTVSSTPKPRKRSGSEKRQRGPVIGFRATAEERASIAAAADRAGLTLGSYIRSRALEKPTTRAVRRPPVETAQLAQILGLLGVLGDDIKRILTALAQGAPSANSEADKVLLAFRSAASAIMHSLGKHPHDN